MIAVPALVYGVGALGFFAVPYTILIYPFLYLTMPRLWAVTHKHGYLTAADFIRGRYGNRALELAVALTGLVATMPYIALQLVGLEKVIAALGFAGQGVYAHAPITIAFLILALYTYKSGLRAPALIAFVKDAMIYVFILAAIIVIPYELGGWDKIFAAASNAYAAKVAAGKVPGGRADLGAERKWGPYITLALGSAMALFMYPHALTGTLAASSGRAIRFNTMTLPAYSLRARPYRAARHDGDCGGGEGQLADRRGAAAHSVGVSRLVRRLLLRRDRARRPGAGGGDVDRRRQHVHPQRLEAVHHPQMTSVEESVVAKLVSLIVKIGALLVIFSVPTQFAVDLQLLGGVWMIQIFPALIFGLFTRWWSGWALLVGWAVGIVVGTALSWTAKGWAPVHKLAWDIPGLGPLDSGLGFAAYNGLTAVLLNIAVATLLSLVMRSRAPDETSAADYLD